MELRCSECNFRDSTTVRRRAMMVVDNLPRDNRFPKDNLTVYVNRDICDICWEKLKRSNQSITEL